MGSVNRLRLFASDGHNHSCTAMCDLSIRGNIASGTGVDRSMDRICVKARLPALESLLCARDIDLLNIKTVLYVRTRGTCLCHDLRATSRR